MHTSYQRVEGGFIKDNSNSLGNSKYWKSRTIMERIFLIILFLGAILVVFFTILLTQLEINLELLQF